MRDLAQKASSPSKCHDCQKIDGTHAPGCSVEQTEHRTDAIAYVTSGLAGRIRLTTDPYVTLRTVLNDAYLQSAEGKGKERHANQLPFDQQPILQIARSVGVGFPMGQAIKKISEASGMLARNQQDAAIAELLGAIVYSAAAILKIREDKKAIDDSKRI
jgi:hypothetical protein